MNEWRIPIKINPKLSNFQQLAIKLTQQICAGSSLLNSHTADLDTGLRSTHKTGRWHLSRRDSKALGRTRLALTVILKCYWNNPKLTIWNSKESYAWEGRKPTENIKWLSRKKSGSNGELKNLIQLNTMLSKKASVILECAKWRAISNRRRSLFCPVQQ